LNYLSDKEESTRRWESSRAAGILSFFAALGLILSPLVFQFTSVQSAMWTSLAVGSVALVLVIVGLGNIRRYIWSSYLILALAAWLVCAPYVNRYADSSAPYWTHIVLGVILSLLAVWRIRDRPGKGGHGKRPSGNEVTHPASAVSRGR
jgi:hypothetical protein